MLLILRALILIVIFCLVLQGWVFFFLLVSFLFSLSSLFIDVPESNADSGSGVLLTFGRIVSAVHRERERHTVAETGEPSHFIESGSCSSHW